MAGEKAVLSADELTDVLNGMLREYEDTEDCEFRGVRWHEPDEDGCNWESTFLGGNVTEYVVEVARHVESRARERYNLAD